MTAEFETIRVTISDAVATVTIDRPESLNAISSKVMAEMVVAAEQLEKNPVVRAVIVTGGGTKAFVAGADIDEMAEMPANAAREFAELGGRLGTAIETSRMPWIAAVRGYAFGGGCELALACDFIHASSTAKFGQPEVKLGVIPGFGGTQRLPRRVGVAKAKELCMTGDTVDATEALRIGLCDAVHAPEELIGKVTELALRIASNGPLAVAEAKRLIHLGQSTSLEHGLALEQRSFGLIFATADQREGMAAFLARPRRAASFTGK